MCRLLLLLLCAAPVQAGIFEDFKTLFVSQESVAAQQRQQQEADMRQREQYVRQGIAAECERIERALYFLEQQQGALAQHELDLRKPNAEWELVDYPTDWQLLLPRHDRAPADVFVAPEEHVAWYVSTKRRCLQAQHQPLVAVTQAVHQLREHLTFIAQRYDEQYVQSVYTTYYKNFSMIPGGFDWRTAYDYLGFCAERRFQITHAQVMQQLDAYKEKDVDNVHAFLHRQLTYLFATPQAKAQYDVALSGPQALAERVLRGDPTYVCEVLTQKIMTYQEKISSIAAVAVPVVQELLVRSIEAK